MSSLRRAALFAATCLAVAASAAAQPSASAAPAGATAAKPAVPVPTGPVPLETFAKLPAIEAPSLSPDGKRLAAKIDREGAQVLVVMPLIGSDKPIAFSPDNADVNWWRWINDEWLAIGVGQNLRGEDDGLYATRVVTISAVTGKVNYVDWGNSGLRADDLLWVARDGSPRFRLAKEGGLFSDERYPSVVDVDASTGRVKRIVAPQADVWDWVADGSGQIRLGVRYNGTSRSFLYRASDSSGWQNVRPKSSDPKDALPMPMVFRADGSAVAIDDPDGRDQVYELALPSFTLGRKLFGVEGYDVDRLMVNAADDDVAGYGYVDRMRRRDYVDPALKDLQHGLDTTLGEGRGRIVSFNRDRSVMLVEVGGADQAGALYYWNTAGEQMQLLGYNSKELRGRKLSPVSTIRYTARDGTAMQAVLTLPRNRPATNLPLILMPHGGPAARDEEAWDWWVQFLAEQGYAVLQPNYRGSTGFGTAFFKLGEGEWGRKMQDDLIDAVDWAAKQGIADPKRVCIVGASYGGYAAMQAAHRDAGHYRCAVSFAGISDLAAMRRYDRDFLLGDGAKRFWAKQAPDFAAVSPRFFAANYAMPILVAHGTQDKRVPVKQSRMLVAELRKAGKPVDYLEQAGGDHHFTRSKDRLQFLQALKRFLDQHNPA